MAIDTLVKALIGIVIAVALVVYIFAEFNNLLMAVEGSCQVTYSGSAPSGYPNTEQRWAVGQTWAAGGPWDAHFDVVGKCTDSTNVVVQDSSDADIGRVQFIPSHIAHFQLVGVMKTIVSIGPIGMVLSVVGIALGLGYAGYSRLRRKTGLGM